jgi:hypothetical protein
MVGSVGTAREGSGVVSLGLVLEATIRDAKDPRVYLAYGLVTPITNDVTRAATRFSSPGMAAGHHIWHRIPLL